MKHEYIRQRDRRIKLAVGVLFIVTLAAGFTLSWLNKSNVSALQSTIFIQAHTYSAQGLRSGMVVSLVGIPVGYIEQIELRDDNKIWLSMAVFEHYQQKIKKDSQLHINSSVIGSIKLDLDLGTKDSQIIEQGDVLNAVRAQSMDDIIDNIPVMQLQFSQLLNETSILVLQLSALDGPLNQGFIKFDNSLALMEEIAINLNSALSGLPGILNNVEKLTVDLAQLASTLNNPQSGIPQTLFSSQQLIVTLEKTVRQKNQEVTELVQSIDQTLHNVDSLLKAMHEISNELKQVAPQTPELIQQAKDTLEQSNSMMRALKNSALLHSVFEEPKINDMLIESPRDEITQ